MSASWTWSYLDAEGAPARASVVEGSDAGAPGVTAAVPAGAPDGADDPVDASGDAAGLSDPGGAGVSGSGGTGPGSTASSAFPSQGDAETWLGSEWHELAAAGVESVTLRCDGIVVYGPMSLRPAQ